MNKIIRISRDYSGERLKNIFLREKENTNDCEKTHSSETVSIENGIVCIATSKISNKWVKKCEEFSKSGCRVYLLLGDQTDNAGIGSLKGICYIRFGLKQKGAVCINRVGPKCNACLFPDDLMERGIKLNESESEAQYKTFCKLFWESEGRTEYFSQDQTEPKAAQKNAVEVHLYDVLSLEKYHDNIKNKIDCKWKKISAFFHLSEYDRMIGTVPENSRYKTAVIAISNGTKSDITDIERYSDETYLVESDTSSVFSAVSDESVSIFSPSITADGSVNWTAERSSEEFERYVSEFRTKWKLHKFKTIKDLISDDVRLLDQPATIKNVGEECRVQKNIVSKDIDEYFEYNEEKLKVRTDFTPELLYGKADFEFTVCPPMCPKGAEKDPLNDEWATAYKKWNDVLDNRKSLIEKTEKQIDEHEPKTESFGSYRAGSKQKIDDCLEEIEELRKIRLGEMTAERRNLQTERYGELFKKTIDVVKGFSDAREIDDLTHQRNKRIDEIKNGKDGIAATEEKITAIREKIPELEKEIKELGRSVDEADKRIENKKDETMKNRNDLKALKAVAKEAEEDNKSEERVISAKKEREGLEKKMKTLDGKDKKDRKEIDKAVNRMKELDKIISSSGTDKKEKRDLEKINREIQQLEKKVSEADEAEKNRDALKKSKSEKTSELNRMNNEIESKEKSLTSLNKQLAEQNKPIIPDQNELSKLLRPNERTPEEFSFPDEDLPDSGLGCTLYSIKGSRYLVFNEDIDENTVKDRKVRNEGKRLNAKICIGVE
ncbi:MAG: hypothetical protein FWH44_00495 [Methanomassiliicoccaceae archaeon]|nr:hypothetical protein [Methanomassiliicoccaceae archaeon]